MGKYARVIDRLPKLLGEDSAYQDKVELVKQEIKMDPDFQQHASTLARMYVETRVGAAPDTIKDTEKEALVTVLGKEGIEELLYLCNLKMTAIEQMLTDQYEVEATSTVKLDTGESVAVQLEPWAQVQDKEVFRQWCIQEGLEALMTIPWATTNSLVKERLLTGQPEPPGVKAYVKTKFVFRRRG